MAYEKQCCICDALLSTEDPTKYFCWRCYSQWQKDILANSKWVRFLVNNEQQRRRYGTYTKKKKRRWVDFTHGLGTYCDIVESSSGRKLIPLVNRGE